MRVYNLLKQELSKKLMTNCKWVSSMAVHPEGKLKKLLSTKMVAFEIRNKNRTLTSVL